MIKTDIALDAFTQVATCPYYLHPKKCIKYNDPNSTYTPPCFEPIRNYSKCTIFTLDLSNIIWNEDLLLEGEREGWVYLSELNEDEIDGELLPVEDDYDGL